ncbi:MULTISPECIES: hypothetical protein [unclassified Rhizobium]|uniref:hypothetical protein n=1 Tax=unclassified Rhizobium TaxID=2613769 RepID=UPI0016493B57|nr:MULTISPECIES: hypothetical protein [unclassified Rhizobium]MCZ3374564.1 hypothetical protein [Rhizobium sp. AG207R]
MEERDTLLVLARDWYERDGWLGLMRPVMARQYLSKRGVTGSNPINGTVSVAVVS